MTRTILINNFFCTLIVEAIKIFLLAMFVKSKTRRKITKQR